MVLNWTGTATDPEVRIPDFLRSNGSETGSTRLVSTTEKLLDRKGRDCGPENREQGRRDPSR
jgi:hypothetical protein